MHGEGARARVWHTISRLNHLTSLQNHLLIISRICLAPTRHTQRRKIVLFCLHKALFLRILFIKSKVKYKDSIFYVIRRE
jgi:hypothetical protein